MGMLAEDVLRLGRLRQRPHEVLGLELTAGPCSELAKLTFDRVVLRSAEKFRRYKVDMATMDPGPMGMAAALEILARTYAES